MKKDYYKKLVKSLLSLDDTPHTIAISFAVGVYISISPFFGFHTILAIILSFLFGLNKVAAIIGSWMNNPWTTPFIYFLDYKIGRFILKDKTVFNIKPFTIEHYLHAGKKAFLDIFVGSIIFGILMSIMNYFMLKYIIEKHRRRRKHVSTKR